jgi:hypothetical protein
MNLPQFVFSFLHSQCTLLPRERAVIAPWLQRLGYGLDERGSILGRDWEFFSSPPLGPTQPPIQWVPGALSPRVKRPGREADHSSPSSAEVKTRCSYTSTPNTSSWRGA